MKKHPITRHPDGSFRIRVRRNPNGTSESVCHACGRWFIRDYDHPLEEGYAQHLKNDCSVHSKSYRRIAFLSGFGGTL